MSVIQVGLVDMTGEIDVDLVHAAAIALNLQVTRDLPQFWPMSATVMYLPNPKKTPAGVWPIQLVKTLPPDEGGFHCDKHKQPYAKVIASKDDPTWTVDASHEILEMLVDPYGNRMQSPVAIEIVGKKSKMAPANTAISWRPATPAKTIVMPTPSTASASPTSSRRTSTILSSLPARAIASPVPSKARVRFSPAGTFLGSIPRDEWQQLMYVDPSKPPTIHNIGKADSSKSLREWIDSLGAAKKITRDSRKVNTPKAKALFKYSAKRIVAMDSLSIAKAKLYK
jgi:hypothetical protein